MKGKIRTLLLSKIILLVIGSIIEDTWFEVFTSAASNLLFLVERPWRDNFKILLIYSRFLKKKKKLGSLNISYTMP